MAHACTSIVMMSSAWIPEGRVKHFTLMPPKEIYSDSVHPPLKSHLGMPRMLYESTAKLIKTSERNCFLEVGPPFFLKCGRSGRFDQLWLRMWTELAQWASVSTSGGRVGLAEFWLCIPLLCVILLTSAAFALQLEILGLSAYKSIAISHLTT